MNLRPLEINNPFPEGSKRAQEYKERLREGSLSHAKARRIRESVRIKRQIEAG